MRVDYLQRQFWAALKQCSTVESPCPKSCEDTDLDCFVIDNNGFILISERPQEMGRFLGEVDGAVMTQLLSMGVFSRVTMYDYQAMCKPPDHHHSAAQTLINSLSAFSMVARWLLHELLLFLLEWSAWGSWNDKALEAKPVFHHSHKHKKQDLLHPCDTEYPVFVHQMAIQETNGIIECGVCQKTFVMQQIPSSNLLFLVTDPTCDCSIFSPVLQEATEVKYNASVKCDRMRSQKPRRRPDSCHAFHQEVFSLTVTGVIKHPSILLTAASAGNTSLQMLLEENAQDCGGASDTEAWLPCSCCHSWPGCFQPRFCGDPIPSDLLRRGSFKDIL